MTADQARRAVATLARLNDLSEIDAAYEAIAELHSLLNLLAAHAIAVLPYVSVDNAGTAEMLRETLLATQAGSE